MMTIDDKWNCVQDHYQKAYKVKFASKPNETVINYLYGEFLKFQENLKQLIKERPELSEKTDLTVGQKIAKKKRLRLLVIENLAKSHPSEFTKI